MPSPAWVTPTHATASTLATAAAFNTHENDLLYLKDRTDNPARASVYHSTTQSIPTGTDTLIFFDSEVADSAALHSTVTNTGRITVPTGETGNWLYTIHLEFAANATGQRKLYFRYNGTTELGGVQVDAAAGGNVTKLSSAILTNLLAGDFLDIVVSQNSGGALNLSATPRFSAQRVS